MSEPIHPDVSIQEIYSSASSRVTVKTKLAAINKLCQARFDAGERSFQPAEIAKHLAETDVMRAGTYLTSAIYCSVGTIWQEYADLVDLDLDETMPAWHPDGVMLRLLSDPKRRGNASSKMRAIFRLCETRYDRGELNFSPSAVAREAFDAGIIPSDSLATFQYKGYIELLGSWQTLVDNQNSSTLELAEEKSPEDVFARELQARGLTAPTIMKLKAIHEVCEARFSAGEYDFGPVVIGKGLIGKNVYTTHVSLANRIKAHPHLYPVIQAWQARADALWIDCSPELPLTNPHSVFQRLRGKDLPAHRLQTLLGVHRICFKEHAAGRKDFSNVTLGKLLEARGLLGASSLYSPSYADVRILAEAWDAHARPHLTKDGIAPPLLKQKKRKSHDSALEWVARDYPQFDEWRLLASEWLQLATGGLPHRLASIIAFFDSYLTRDDVPDSPIELLRRGSTLPAFEEVSSQGSAAVTKKKQSNTICEFLDWVLLKKFSDESDDGTLLVSPAFRNPFSVVFVPSTGDQPSQSVRSPLPYGYIHTLRRMLASGLNFRDWHFAQTAQGADVGGLGRPARDWYVVDRESIDEDDPDCVWRIRNTGKKGMLVEMWSPVRSVAVLIKLLLPLRTGQVRMLDSGESDTWKYKDGKWELNDHALAEKNGKAVWQQGIFRRHLDITAQESESVRLYITTNKTSDIDKVGASKGYVMDWFNAPDKLDDVFYWLEKLRDWQAKYNPIKRRTNWSELGAKHISAKTSDQLASYLPTCFLFRMPEDPPEYRGLPVTDSAVGYAWGRLLEGLQDALAARGETHPGGHPIVFMARDQRGRIISNDFPLHSLRVSLITAFALDGGVPFAIMQKLVGHSRLLMTLYYTKPGQRRVGLALTEAAERLDNKKEESIHGFLLDTEHEALITKGIFVNSAAAAAAIPIRREDRNPAGWMLMHHGLCLVGGNTSEQEDNSKIGGCYNGGPNLGSGIHGLVPGGIRNCIRCRWFGTEPHYLAALAAHFTSNAYRFDESRDRSVKAEKVYQELLRKKATQERAGDVFSEQKHLLQAERIMESALSEFSTRAEDLVATYRLVERCRDVLNSGPADGWQLVIQGEVSAIEAVFEETDSELLQLCGVCESIQLYPDLESDKAILRRSQLLDSALYNEGIAPMFLKLTQDEQLKVGNAFMRSLSLRASPDSLFIGQRRVVEIIDAGEKLGESLGINLLNALSELSLDHQPKPVIKLKVAK